MDFRKEMSIPKSELRIDYHSRLLLLGSCFTDHIGKYLVDSGFNSMVNPFGVLYNPISISQSLKFLIDKKTFLENDIFNDKGVYNSLYFHSYFANPEAQVYLNQVNDTIITSAAQLLEADVLFITFGTAFIYTHKETNEVVTNCHKLPATNFERRRLSISDIVSEWTLIIDQLLQYNPNLKILFTVSPIRHLRDGEHQNQLSKSILLLAIDEIMKLYNHIFYFPSFEILMDDLRDYRFYADDMIHPNNLAIKYIWERFRETFFDNATKSILIEWMNLSKMMNHIPLNGSVEEYKQFLKQTLLKLDCFKNKYPYFECENAILRLKAKLA